jgi:hypothetical protein
MPFMAFFIGLFLKFIKVGGGWGGVNYVFPGLWQQLRCQAEGKKVPNYSEIMDFSSLLLHEHHYN